MKIFSNHYMGNGYTKETRFKSEISNLTLPIEKRIAGGVGGAVELGKIHTTLEGALNTLWESVDSHYNSPKNTATVSREVAERIGGCEKINPYEVLNALLTRVDNLYKTSGVKTDEVATKKIYQRILPEKAESIPSTGSVLSLTA